MNLNANATTYYSQVGKVATSVIEEILTCGKDSINSFLKNSLCSWASRIKHLIIYLLCNRALQRLLKWGEVWKGCFGDPNRQSNLPKPSRNCVVQFCCYPTLLFSLNTNAFSSSYEWKTPQTWGKCTWGFITMLESMDCWRLNRLLKSGWASQRLASFLLLLQIGDSLRACPHILWRHLSSIFPTRRHHIFLWAR